MNKVAVIIACAAVSFLCGWLVNGWRLEGDYNKEKIALLNAKAKLEQDLNTKSESYQAELRRQKDEATKKINTLNARIASGELRLSVRTTKCGSSTTEPGLERAELNREDAESLIRIANEGDDAIRERNYCIKAYNEVRNSLRN